MNTYPDKTELMPSGRSPWADRGLNIINNMYILAIQPIQPIIQPRFFTNRCGTGVYSTTTITPILYGVWLYIYKGRGIFPRRVHDMRLYSIHFTQLSLFKRVTKNEARKRLYNGCIKR